MKVSFIRDFEAKAAALICAGVAEPADLPRPRLAGSAARRSATAKPSPATMAAPGKPAKGKTEPRRSYGPLHMTGAAGKPLT